MRGGNGGRRCFDPSVFSIGEKEVSEILRVHSVLDARA